MAAFLRRLLLHLLSSACLGAVGTAACIASAPEGIHRQTDDGAGGTGGLFNLPDGAAFDSSLPDLPNSDPHALIGVDPSHGPFTGGQRAIVRGKGFTSGVRVWFGDTEADPAAFVPIDTTRVQVSTPPGKAGPVDIHVQNGMDESTRRSLAGGFVYDAFYALPASGPISGGTIVEIIGQGTLWDASTVAKVDQKPCQTLQVQGPELLMCTVPKGTPGAKTISVTTGAETIHVLDGYTYEDSENGYKGGLSGSPLAGDLKVLVYDNYTGDPLVGAHVVVGTSLATALTAQADGYGVALFSDPQLNAPRTITIAAKCHNPISFVDVPVDTVTAYLDPLLTPQCASDGDPPPVGGKPGSTGTIHGELVWPSGVDSHKGPWDSVPQPLGPNERRAAYIFLATTDPMATFQLPSPSTAVLPDAPGNIGYQFSLSASPGNRTLYALAGIENQATSPFKFTAYAMGIAKGVSVTPGAQTDDVYIPMNHLIDQALTMQVDAPAPGPKGPDRLRASVAVMLGNDGFAILPAGQKTPLLPLAGPLSFIGLPALVGDLVGSTYISSARAVTGPTFTAPMSVVGRLLTTTTSQVVAVDGFVGIPLLATPALNTAWDGMHLATTFGAGGSAIDLSVYDIVSGNGLARWTVAVPKGSHTIELPDISGFELAALPPGPIMIGIYGARIDGFNYAELRYRHLRPPGMTAYSLDYFMAHIP